MRGPGRWVLLATVLGSAIASTDAAVVGIALPAIGRDFGTSLATLQWVVTVYTLTLAGLLFIPAGGSGRARQVLLARPALARSPSLLSGLFRLVYGASQIAMGVQLRQTGRTGSVTEKDAA